MTTILAVRDSKECWIAWDTLTTMGSTATYGADPAQKLRRIGQSYVAVAGFSVYGNMLEALESKKTRVRLDTRAAVFRFFLGLWRDFKRNYHFVDDQYDSEDKAPFADMGAEFMVVNKAGIFHVKEILSVARFESICAIGSGSPHAEAAAWALHGEGLRPAEIVQKSMDIALRFDRASGGDVKTVRLSMS